MTQLNLINLKNIFLYEIGLIAIREVSPPFDEEQQYWRPYQPKHSPSLFLHSQIKAEQPQFHCVRVIRSWVSLCVRSNCGDGGTQW